MKINIGKINKIISILIAIVIIAGVVAYFLLNDMQRIVVAIGVVLIVLNLFGMRFFFNKNSGRKR